MRHSTAPSQVAVDSNSKVFHIEGQSHHFDDELYGAKIRIMNLEAQLER
jgi:hypothetical protein